mmetsp:Transcript_42429/g.72187  ORF Transcript_42429/g.72187 Transcript_42429/m.72187 type:complete len:236 (-) Transcript_42429:532-1239(-)
MHCCCRSSAGAHRVSRVHGRRFAREPDMHKGLAQVSNKIGVRHGACRVHVSPRVHVGEDKSSVKHGAGLHAQVVDPALTRVLGLRHVQEVSAVLVVLAAVKVKPDVRGEHLAEAIVPPAALEVVVAQQEFEAEADGRAHCEPPLPVGGTRGRSDAERFDDCPHHRHRESGRLLHLVLVLSPHRLECRVDAHALVLERGDVVESTDEGERVLRDPDCANIVLALGQLDAVERYVCC